MRKGGVRNVLSHRTFVDGFLNACQIEGLDAIKLRRKEGIYISGIQLDPNIYLPSHQYGSPLEEDLDLDNSTSLDKTSKGIVPLDQFLGIRILIQFLILQVMFQL